MNADMRVGLFLLLLAVGSLLVAVVRVWVRESRRVDADVAYLRAVADERRGDAA